MVKIIEEIRKPSFAEQFGKSISAGISGAGQLGKEYQRVKDEKAKKTADRLKGFSITFDKYLKAYKEEIPGQISKVDKEAIMLKARKFVEEGADPEEAIRFAWQEAMTGKTENKEQTFFEKLQQNYQENRKKESEFISWLGDQAYGAGAKMLGGVAGLAQFPLSVLSELGRYGRKGLYKAFGLSDEEIEQKEKKYASDIKAGEEATGIIAPMGGTTLPEALAKATKGASVAQTPAQRIIQGAVAGPEGIIASGAEEAAKGLGLPESVQTAVGISTFILAGHGQVPSKIANFAKNAVKRAEKIAQKRNVPTEEIIKEAEATGNVDIDKVNEGNGREIQKLNRSLNDIESKTSQAFKESEKFAQKEHEKIRQETARKLAISPLEKYYTPTKVEPKTAEGRLAKQLREAPIKQRRDEILKEIKQPEFLRKSPLEQEAKLHELKEAEFELKWGKKPTTQAEIEAQIEKQHNEIREYLTNPSSEKIKKVQKQLQKDKEVIKEAQVLAERGELPGPRVIDEFIKIHEQYLKGYDRLANELADFIQKNKGNKQKAAQVARADELQKLINDMAEAGKAKVTMQIDKRKALGALERPSGAFYKSQLKDLHGDIDNFNKQLFKVNRILSPESIKTAKVAKREIGKVQPKTEKVASEVKKTIENPTKENIEKVSEETGTKEETLGEYLKRMTQGKKEIAKNPTEEKTESMMNYMIFPKIRTLKKQIRNGIILASVSNISEEVFGFQIPKSLLYTLSGSLGVYGGTATTAINQGVQWMFNSMHANELKRLRNNPEEFRKAINKIEKKYTKTRYNKILKMMKQP